MRGLYYPFPIGKMPEGVHYSTSTNPAGRLEMVVVADGPYLQDGWERWVRDGFSGERFAVRSADCGLGCHCAAEAMWLQVSDDDDPPGIRAGWAQQALTAYLNARMGAEITESREDYEDDFYFLDNIEQLIADLKILHGGLG